MKTAQEDREFQQIVYDVLKLANILNILLRAPRYRYFGRQRQHGDRAYCYTTEPARDERGRMRYASWVFRVQGDKLVPGQRRDHVTRRAAKARALKLYDAAQAVKKEEAHAS